MRRSFMLHVGLDGVYNGDDEFMAGESIMFSGPADKIPAGYLIEDGSEVGRMAYATLFAAIGTTYGAGDGATTFNLPDSRGEFWRGLDLGRGGDAGRAMGSVQGDAGRDFQASLIVVQWDGWPLNGDIEVLEDSGSSVHGAGGLFREKKLRLKAGWPQAGEFRPRNIAKIPLIKYS